MVLAIDVGNSQLVIGFIDDGRIVKVARMQTAAGQMEAEYAIKLKQLMELYGLCPESIEGAILSSVVPPVTGELMGAVKELTGCRCLLVGPGIKTGLNVRLDDPGSLAGDLVAGSVAAVRYYGAPAIVLDMGTATVMAVIDKNGCYIGGAILPGVRSSYNALADRTSLLPDISIVPPKKVVAANTVDAMRSGAVFGTAAAIDGMIERMEEELGYSCRIVATGDLARSVTPCCKHQIICDEELLLKGLWTIYQKNRR